MDGYLGYHLTAPIPGSRAYMRNQRSLGSALIYNKGTAAIFITISANLKGWQELQDYMQKVWLFRSDLNVERKALEDYDVPFATLYVCHKFRAIRSLLTCKSPGMLSVRYFNDVGIIFCFIIVRAMEERNF